MIDPAAQPIPADEHDILVSVYGPRGPRHAWLSCRNCGTATRPLNFYDYTLNLAVKAHRQYVAAKDLARNGRSAC